MTGRRGTTVLELVVALAITGAVASIGAGVFGQLLDGRQRVIEATRETERAAAARALLREWLVAGSIELPSTTLRVQPRGPDDTNGLASLRHEINFTTTAPTPARAANARLRLYVDSVDDTPESGLVLAYRRDQAVAWERRQLDSAIVGMVVTYLDSATGRWLPADEAVSLRPVAMQVRFERDGETGARLWLLPITLPFHAEHDRSGGAR